MHRLTARMIALASAVDFSERCACIVLHHENSSVAAVLNGACQQNCKFSLKRAHSRNFCNPLLRATPFTHHTNDVQNDFAVSGYRNLQSAVNRKARNDLFHYRGYL